MRIVGIEIIDEAGEMTSKMTIEEIEVDTVETIEP